jgi:hypothetical protein
MKDGYQAVSQDVTVQAGGAGSVSLNLPSRTEVTSQFGRLTVTSNVVGAEILIDGETQPGWETPHTFERVRAGDRLVAVEENFYQTARRTVTVPVGGSASVDLRLDLGTGRVKIVTSPPGLEVFIDGQPQGRSPITTNIDAGHHTYKIVGPPGRDPKEDTVDIHSGESWEKIVRWE